MSRWKEEFDRHPFQPEWQALLDEVGLLKIDDETVITTVQELVRLRRVIAYLANILTSVDPELTPKSIWDNFAGQLTPCLQQVRNYASSRSEQNLQAANQHADNLLTYVKPYMVLPGEALSALSDSLNVLRSSLEGYVESFSAKAEARVGRIHDGANEMESLLVRVQESYRLISELKVELLDGSGDVDSIEVQVKDAKESVEKKLSEIESLRVKLLEGTEDQDSIQDEVESARDEVLARRNEIARAVEGAKKEIDALMAFYKKIFGEADENGVYSGGLKSELDTRLKQLVTYEQEQQAKHLALHGKIESLLPGATSAGLARAYQELRRSFGKPIRNFSYLFYCTIALIPVIAFVASIESFSIAPFAFKVAQPTDLESVLKLMLVKLPFVAPLIWLAIFASIRRSQYERLKQEYAHKEALAKSYESYKKQLATLLQTDAEPLQRELIQKAIDAVAYNASKTLDGRHHDKMPIEQIVDYLASDKSKGLLDRIKQLLPN